VTNRKYYSYPSAIYIMRASSRMSFYGKFSITQFSSIRTKWVIIHRKQLKANDTTWWVAVVGRNQYGFDVVVWLGTAGYHLPFGRAAGSKKRTSWHSNPHSPSGHYRGIKSAKEFRGEIFDIKVQRRCRKSWSIVTK